MLVWLATTASAATDAPTLTLTTAVRNTLAQNPSLAVFEFQNAAFLGKADTASLRPGYELGLETENFAGSGDLQDFDAAEVTVALSSVIELGDKLAARQGMVASERSVLAASRQAQALELMGEVTRRYVVVLAAQEQVSLARNAAELADETLEMVASRARAGATPEAEVKRAQAAAAQAALALVSEQQQLANSKTALAAMWGARRLEYLKVEGDLFSFGEDVAIETLYAAVENNPAIEILAAENRVREAAMRLAQTQSSADIDWSVGLRQLQEGDDTALVAGISMPLFASRRNVGAIATARAERDEIHARREVALLDLHTQVYMAFHNRKQAIEAVDALSATIIPALKQALDETGMAYEQGRYGYLEYASARQELLAARHALIEAATAALSYGVEIEQLTAAPLSAAEYGQDPTFQGTTR